MTNYALSSENGKPDGSTAECAEGAECGKNEKDDDKKDYCGGLVLNDDSRKGPLRQLVYYTLLGCFTSTTKLLLGLSWPSYNLEASDLSFNVLHFQVEKCLGEHSEPVFNLMSRVGRRLTPALFTL